MPISRPYDPDRDRDHALRIWREVGWIAADKQSHTEAFDLHVSEGGARVVEQDGAAEAMVCTGPGAVCVDGTDLPASFVTSVTVSRVARRKGYATRATAEAIAQDADAGAALSVLGIFDQGFYDRLGYGTGRGQLFQRIDPANLKVPVPKRTPVRLSVDDFEEVHAARVGRLRGHGGCNLHPPSTTRCEMLWSESPYGIGFRDDDGVLTHHLWLQAENESGPWKVEWYAYRTADQLIELLGLLKGLSDQVRSVRIPQPPLVQLQDLLDRPFRNGGVRRGGEHGPDTRWLAWWQMRINDLPRCVGALSLPGALTEFDLVLDDPLAELVDGAGVGGRWTVRLGPESAAERGHRGGLPVLEASVGAFTRLWLGVLPATTLAVSDRLAGPKGLLQRLDRVVRLPEPCADWPF